MLWGQCIKVYTDHKYLVKYALGLTCDPVYRWLLLLEEYGPQIVYIKGVDNIVADAIRRLNNGNQVNTRNINAHVHNMTMVKLFNGYVKKTTNSKAFQTDDMYVPTGTYTFANQLESLRATSYEAYANQVKHHFEYLFPNASAKDKDEI